MTPRKRNPKTEAILQDLKDERYTASDVAEKHNVPMHTVRNLSYNYNIKLSRKIKPQHRKIIDLVKSRKLTVKEVAEQCNVTPSTVYYACRKYGIEPSRPKRQDFYPLLHDRNWLYKRAVKEQRTYQEIADMAGGCTRERVRQRIKESGWQGMRQRKRNTERSKQDESD